MEGKTVMNSSRQYLMVVIILNLLWEQLPPPLLWGQNTDATLRLTPPTLEVAAGQTVDIAVTVDNVSGLYGFDITVSYDPAIAQVVDLDPNLDGIQLALGLFLDPGFVIFNQADNNLGQLRLAMTQLDSSTARNGSGNLIIIRFQALQTGNTPLLLTGQLAQWNGDTIFPLLVNGQLSVTTTPQEQPIVFTPIPSQIAGTPLPPMISEPLATSATELASVITAAGTALVSNLTQANDGPAVIVDSETTILNENETAGITSIGVGSPAESSNIGEVIGNNTNRENDSWITGASLGGGLLLAIIVLFFYLSRKRAGDAS
jgi:hypothetical protein